MITKFKIFENINENPKIGDWVFIDCEDFKTNAKVMYDYLKNNPISEISNIHKVHGRTNLVYNLNFDNLPNILQFFNSKDWEIHQFKNWSNSKEELESLLTSKKYNI